jgi:hypothetical protein
MRWYDEASGQPAGKNYLNIIEKSREREASLGETRQEVMAELLENAYLLDEPMQAVKLMWKIIKNHAVEASFKNHYIDPIVFGARAAGSIIEARHFIATGQEHLARQSMERAQKTAVAGGCGGGSEEEDEDGNPIGKNGVGSQSKSGENYKFNKKAYCVVCQAPPKKGEAKKWCGPCSICRPCDKSLKKKA